MTKSKLYGGRWRTTGTLGEGGQSVVYRATDESGEHRGEHALKRVLSSLRDDRFLKEVQASLRLTHENVVPVVDHSLGAEPDPKHFIVTKLAAGGDLSRRVGLYAGNLDSTLVVARGLCGALSHAHSQSIIHRDVKPENVLFRTSDTHDPWLADFGICFFADATARATEVNERVGPAYFLAPELEAGGILDVTPAADVYSLGKLIYYMISGGRVLPRESLFEADSSSWEAKGPRHHLLKLLLGKMICLLPNRLRAIADVDNELSRIQSWEERVAGVALTPASIGLVSAMKEDAQAARATKERNERARMNEIARVGLVSSQFADWTQNQFVAAREQLAEPSFLDVHVRDHDRSRGSAVTSLKDQRYQIISGREIAFVFPQTSFQVEHVLEFALCSLVRLSRHADGRHELPERDLLLIAFPWYYLIRHSRDRRPPIPATPSKCGFPVPQPPPRQPDVLELRFKLSEWPGVVDRLHLVLAPAMEETLRRLRAGATCR